MRKLNKILLIDDDKINNYLNEILLQDLNIAEEIKVVLNGQLALDYILDSCKSTQKICPELIILDHYMPVMDGIEFMEALNKEDFINRANVVFILLAIHSTKEDIETFKKLGVQEFTSKPLSKETVLEVYHKYWAGDTAKKT